MTSEAAVFWVAGITVTVIIGLIGVVWKLLRDESSKHAEDIKAKADSTQVTRTEERWSTELTAVEERLKDELKEVKANSTYLINKLEARHDKEIEQEAIRLRKQIEGVEDSILTHIRQMVEIMKAGK